MVCEAKIFKAPLLLVASAIVSSVSVPSDAVAWQ